MVQPLKSLNPVLLKLYSFLFLLFTPAVAFSHPLDTLEKGEAYFVKSVIDGDTLVLATNKQVRFVGIQAPKLPLGRKNFPEWPLAKEAKVYLEEIALNKMVTLYFGKTKRDRHGRILAHLKTDDGLWLQDEMLRRGLARVYTFPDNRQLAAELYQAEQYARQKQQGIWTHPFYAVRAPFNLDRDIGTFQIIEGRILDTARVKGTIYLNFGQDWRTDFTVAIHSKARKLFETAGIDLLALKHKTLRVRGWLKKRNGPMIDATHPEQIEIFQ